MRDEIERYKKARVQPFGVNKAGVDSHRKYAEKFGFPFPLLSDADLAVTDAYGALKLVGKGIQRTVVLIGEDGKVRFAERGAPGPDRSLAVLA